MSVLINMEMPKSCAFCRFNGAYCYAKGDEDAHSTVPCPLIPVQQHGRLIDADEMFVEFVIEGQRSKRYKLGEKWELNGEEIRSVISRLPTIIPAELPKEETK